MGEFLNSSYHANCSIPVFTGFERIYQQTGEAQLHAAAVNFVNEVIDHRSWIIGGNSAREHFFPPAQFESALHEPAGPENCNSVNMLRLIEAVYTTQPDAHFMDHYERILWNHLLAAHDPDRGMIAYYTPMQPGSYRVYADEFDSMWCCVGTGLECPGKYGTNDLCPRPRSRLGRCQPLHRLAALVERGRRRSSAGHQLPGLTLHHHNVILSGPSRARSHCESVIHGGFLVAKCGFA